MDGVAMGSSCHRGGCHGQGCHRGGCHRGGCHGHTTVVLTIVVSIVPLDHASGSSLRQRSPQHHNKSGNKRIIEMSFVVDVRTRVDKD